MRVNKWKYIVKINKVNRDKKKTVNQKELLGLLFSVELITGMWNSFKVEHTQFVVKKTTVTRFWIAWKNIRALVFTTYCDVHFKTVKARWRSQRRPRTAIKLSRIIEKKKTTIIFNAGVHEGSGHVAKYDRICCVVALINYNPTLQMDIL